MSHAIPIVFVVDDDISVRESLELLIRCEGWQPETFASAPEFLARPRDLVPSFAWAFGPPIGMKI
jgi:FixJ family two-component response regulator